MGHDNGAPKSVADLLLHAAPVKETRHLTKEEEAALSRFRPLSYMTTPKSPDIATYRDFISGMAHVLNYILSFGFNDKGYVAT